MIPHTTETLKLLTWSELRTLHSSLKLKAGGKRADYEARILELQPITIADIAAPTSFTCAQCPFARLIEDNKYCCEVSQTASDVRLGHWEATVSCFESLAESIAELDEVVEAETPIAPEPIAPEEIAVIQPISLAERMTGLTRHPFRYEWDVHQGKHSFSASCFGLCECSRCERERELPLNEQRRGSHQIMLERLSQVKAPTPVIQPPKNRADVQNFTLDLSVLSVAATNNAARNSEAEGTIHWHSPLQGTIAGKKGALRNFYIRSRNCLININLNDPATYEIMLAVNANFTAAESKHPNVRHQQIRSAIEAGRVFAPKTFKNSPQFLMHTENYRDIGRIMQGKDGRWWAWLNSGITGHPFDSENQAYKYLDFAADQRNQSQKLQACVN